MRLSCCGTRLALLALSLAGCSGKPEPPKVPMRPEPSAERVEAAMPIVEASNAFGLKLLDLLAAKTDKPNLLISPISLQMASALLLESAVDPERDEMKQALGLGSVSDQDLGTLVETLTDALLSDPERPLQLANAVWLTREVPIEKAFAERIAQRYGAKIGVSKSPVEAMAAINAWVKENTDGMIPSLLDDAAPPDSVYLLNAVAFHARWNKAFEEKHTRPGDFTTADGHVVQVPLMWATVEAQASLGKAAVGVKIDYLGGKFSMLALLPHKGLTPRDVLNTLVQGGFAEADSGLRNQSKVSVSFPKFRWAESETLDDQFRALGVRKAFEHLDQSPLSSDLAENMVLARVLQKSFIEVDERGTRAAAATAQRATKGGPWRLQFNRPFLYTIVHNPTGAILFLGICGDPTVER